MPNARKRVPKPLLTGIDPGELSRLILTELTGPLENALESKKKAGAVKRVVEAALLNTFAEMSRSRQLDSKRQRESLSRGKSRKLGIEKSAIPLPVADLTPHEVIESGLVEMSLSQLYRGFCRVKRSHCPREVDCRF